MRTEFSGILARRPYARLWLAAGLLLGAMLAAAMAGPARAQDWQQQWRDTVAAAEKEGIVVMSTQPNRAMSAYVRREWPKAYPRIKLSMSVIGGSKLVTRVKQERAAGKKLWDLAFNGGSAGYQLYKQGALDPVVPELIRPDVGNPALWGGWDNAFYDAEKKYVMSISSFLKSPYYNPKFVSKEKVDAMGFKALLDPAFKGRIYWHEPLVPGSGQSFSFVLHRALGADGLTRLIRDQKVVFVANQNDVVEAMAREKAWITIGPVVTALLERYRKAGLTIDVHPFGNTPETTEMSTGGSTVYVFEGRPHPNAARVFLNWLLSKEVSTGLAKAMHQTWRRTDVPSPVGADETPIRGLKYLETQREEHLKDIAAAGRLIRQVRGK